MRGDPTVRIAFWTGVGPGAGFARGGADQTPGVLVKAAGGTLFIDEMHDLDKESQRLLIDIIDKHPIPLAAGKGADVLPNVTLILASNQDFSTLCKQLDHDLVRRLRQNFITIPPLAERKEDIPVFVRKILKDRTVTPSFYLALFEHEWAAGQVAELLVTLDTVKDRHLLIRR
jgi:two-component system NtrC family response regulator